MSDEVITVVVSDPETEEPTEIIVGDFDLVATAALIEDHRNESEPHTAYDDMASLTLIFENGLH